MPRNNMLTVGRRDEAAEVNTSALRDFQAAICAGEEELLREIVCALRTIRFGSIIKESSQELSVEGPVVDLQGS